MKRKVFVASAVLVLLNSCGWNSNPSRYKYSNPYSYYDPYYSGWVPESIEPKKSWRNHKFTLAHKKIENLDVIFVTSSSANTSQHLKKMLPHLQVFTQSIAAKGVKLRVGVLHSGRATGGYLNVSLFGPDPIADFSSSNHALPQLVDNFREVLRTPGPGGEYPFEVVKTFVNQTPNRYDFLREDSAKIFILINDNAKDFPEADKYFNAINSALKKDWKFIEFQSYPSLACGGEPLSANYFFWYSGGPTYRLCGDNYPATLRQAAEDALGLVNRIDMSEYEEKYPDIDWWDSLEVSIDGRTIPRQSVPQSIAGFKFVYPSRRIEFSGGYQPNDQQQVEVSFDYAF